VTHSWACKPRGSKLSETRVTAQSSRQRPLALVLSANIRQPVSQLLTFDGGALLGFLILGHSSPSHGACSPCTPRILFWLTAFCLLSTSTVPQSLPECCVHLLTLLRALGIRASHLPVALSDSGTLAPPHHHRCRQDWKPQGL
jgi:hypothetical protein